MQMQLLYSTLFSVGHNEKRDELFRTAANTSIEYAIVRCTYQGAEN